MEFSKWWVNEFKTVKFPSQGTIFDYYIDPETKKFMLWTEKVPKFELDPEVPLQVFPTSSPCLCVLFVYRSMVFPLSNTGQDPVPGAAQGFGLAPPRRRVKPNPVAFCGSALPRRNLSESCKLQLFFFNFRLSCGFVDSHEIIVTIA